jgi:catechol 2,3-dioxygenase-like lactoylglutathione lyase family enzyme
MILDHIGIAVRSIERSIEHCHAVFGYEQMTEIVVNTRQKVRVVFLARRGSLPVKLLEPRDPTSLDLRVRSARRGLHHLCLRCESVGAEVARLEALGLRVIAPRSPGERSRTRRSPSSTSAMA